MDAQWLRQFQQCLEIFMSVKRCSVIFSNDQRFSVLIIAVSALKIAEFLLCNNTDHGCFNSVTVILIEIHAMCINYQFSNILKNLIASLIQSAVSMIIAESSKDINPDKVLSRGGCSGLFWFQLILTNTCQLLGVRPLLFKQLKSQNCPSRPA